jgi:flagellar biosynthesis/type III secretory pathway M-ring protein FliF/YscJ
MIIYIVGIVVIGIIAFVLTRRNKKKRKAKAPPAQEPEEDGVYVNEDEEYPQEECFSFDENNDGQ